MPRLTLWKARGDSPRPGVEGPPLRRGDIVRLRSPREILATLDGTASLEGLPFMPEMLAFFGRRYAVAARVERACDTIGYTGARRIPDAVTLADVRCTGKGHGGCQAGCLVYWNEKWLCTETDVPLGFEPDDAFAALSDLAVRNARVASGSGAVTDVYRCQATEFLHFTEHLPRWDARSFLREVGCGNVSLWTFIRVMFGILVNTPRRRRGVEKPFSAPGTGSRRTKLLSIEPGSRVRVRTRDEIADTLDANSKLRGLWFDREMVPYCGTTATVKAKVERFIDETSGVLVELQSDAFILEGVVCKGQISDGRWFCCRAIYPWWREAWLEPVLEDSS